MPREPSPIEKGGSDHANHLTAKPPDFMNISRVYASPHTRATRQMRIHVLEARDVSESHPHARSANLGVRCWLDRYSDRYTGHSRYCFADQRVGHEHRESGLEVARRFAFGHPSCLEIQSQGSQGVVASARHSRDLGVHHRHTTRAPRNRLYPSALPAAADGHRFP